MKCRACPAAETDRCPGENAERVCWLAVNQPGYADAVRLHAASFSLPSLEDAERIVAMAQQAMASGPRLGGCCG